MNKLKTAELATREWLRSNPTEEDVIGFFTLLSAELREHGACSLGKRFSTEASDLSAEAAQQLEYSCEPQEEGALPCMHEYSSVVDGDRHE